jgi:hypothetical protein
MRVLATGVELLGDTVTCGDCLQNMQLQAWHSMQMYIAGMAELDTVYIRMIAGAFDYHHYNTIDFSILSYHALPCEIPCFHLL